MTLDLAKSTTSTDIVVAVQVPDDLKLSAVVIVTVTDARTNPTLGHRTRKAVINPEYGSIPPKWSVDLVTEYEENPVFGGLHDFSEKPGKQIIEVEVNEPWVGVYEPKIEYGDLEGKVHAKVIGTDGHKVVVGGAPGTQIAGSQKIYVEVTAKKGEVLDQGAEIGLVLEGSKGNAAMGATKLLLS